MQEQYLHKRKEYCEALGRVMFKLRMKAGKSVREIAREAELSKTTWLLAEKGELDPQITTFCRIAEVFYMNADKFFMLIKKELPKNWSFFDEN